MSDFTALLAGSHQCALPLHQIVELVMKAYKSVDGRTSPDSPRAASGVHLSPRELEIMGHILMGLANKEIASKLFVQEKTIKFHATKIYKKLGVKNRQALIVQEISRALNLKQD